MRTSCIAAPGPSNPGERDQDFLMAKGDPSVIKFFFQPMQTMTWEGCMDSCPFLLKPVLLSGCLTLQVRPHNILPDGEEPLSINWFVAVRPMDEDSTLDQPTPGICLFYCSSFVDLCILFPCSQRRYWFRHIFLLLVVPNMPHISQSWSSLFGNFLTIL